MKQVRKESIETNIFRCTFILLELLAISKNKHVDQLL